MHLGILGFTRGACKSRRRSGRDGLRFRYPDGKYLRIIRAFQNKTGAVEFHAESPIRNVLHRAALINRYRCGNCRRLTQDHEYRLNPDRAETDVSG